MVRGLKGALVATAAFVAMEPVAYAAHRWVMHGPGHLWHDSHHEHPGLEGRRHLEANDLFPVCFAAATVVAFALGSSSGERRARTVRPVAAGVTAYGLAYAFVHDVYIHRRLAQHPEQARPRHPASHLEVLRTAHARHHATGGEPYGMLFPVTAKRTRTPALREVPA